LNHLQTKKKSPANVWRGFLQYFCPSGGQLAVDVAECVADPWTEQSHNSNHNDGDECENDRILDETLTFFFGSE
jgi:hypothetical protein